jgi:hypothetical protein
LDHKRAFFLDKEKDARKESTKSIRERKTGSSTFVQSRRLSIDRHQERPPEQRRNIGRQLEKRATRIFVVQLSIDCCCRLAGAEEELAAVLHAAVDLRARQEESLLP